MPKLQLSSLYGEHFPYYRYRQKGKERIIIENVITGVIFIVTNKQFKIMDENNLIL